MNAWEPIAAPAEPPTELDDAPYDVHRPRTSVANGPPPTPLVFASPHSGRFYPPQMMAVSALDSEAIRRSEDAFVDTLIDGATTHGATLLSARYARAYIDVNREPYELDPAMFEDELPEFARGRTARVAAGLGSIARIVAEGQEIYTRKLTFAEARRRIETVHQPWHAKLSELLAEAKAAFGCALLVDWHSMPSAAASGEAYGGGRRRRACDMVLGDRFGAACAPSVTSLVERELEAMGYLVARNAPYAGGHTTEHYGRPAEKTYALQIEINRAIYLDEASMRPNHGFERLKKDLGRLSAALAAIDWTRLS